MAEPDAFHVAFAFNYDANMILKDVPRARLQRLYQTGFARWGDFRIEYRSGKWFQVSKTVGNDKVCCKIWDVWSFFQCKFIKALRDYLGDRPEFDRIESGKELRGEFRPEQIESLIKPYWQDELYYTVRLADRLRSYLYSAELFISQWHGPGAIASYALRKHKIHEHMAICPPEVNDAAQYAYAGGRFELFKLGVHIGPLYQADINSAYPEGISHLPSLKHGLWRRTYRFEPKWRFAVYHIKMRGGICPPYVPHPLFFRDDKHCIHYPPLVEGWYWAPEVANIHKWPQIEIVEGWVFEDDGSYPFAWVRDVYNTRRRWKTEKNPCEKALKLLLNSLYGKMAQRVGWDKKKNKPPRWHQLEWAGWVTSYARAKLYRAMIAAGPDLVAVETDAVFSTRKLNLDYGKGLGQWDLAEYSEGIYLQSGFRFVKDDDGWKSKFRGFDSGSVKLDEVFQYLENVDFTSALPPAPFIGETTRFIAMGMAFAKRPMPNGDMSSMWRVWNTEKRELRIGSDGKRIHVRAMCRACKMGQSVRHVFHDLSVARPQGGQSIPHGLPWKQPLDQWQESFDLLKSETFDV